MDKFSSRSQAHTTRCQRQPSSTQALRKTRISAIEIRAEAHQTALPNNEDHIHDARKTRLTGSPPSTPAIL